jgi:sporulation protein YlmC with PRC-barrel domain
MAFLHGTALRRAFLIAGLPLCFAIPAYAQSNANSVTNTGSATTSTSNVSNKALGDAAPQASLTQTHGMWRASELVGATVHNDQGNTVGTVSDLLISSDGTIKSAVLSVGGFLGMSTKLVEVPFDQMKFVPAKNNPASQGAPGTSAAPANSTKSPAETGSNAGSGSGSPQPTTSTQNNDYGLVLPNATRSSLKSQSDFSYNNS